MFDLSLSNDGVASLVLNAPERLNALRKDDWTRLAALVAALSSEPKLRALLIKGAGEKAFCAGGDIKEFQALRMGADAAQAYNAEVDKALAAIVAVPVPTLAQIHASCFGGGLMIALSCDLRFAKTEASFCAPPAKMSFTYNASAIQLLVDLIGKGRAKDLLFTARTFGADEALVMGLLNGVSDDLDGLVEKRLGQILALAPLSHRAHKTILRENPEPGSLAERALTDHLYDSEDYRAAVEAFAARTKPTFKGQ